MPFALLTWVSQNFLNGFCRIGTGFPASSESALHSLPPPSILHICEAVIAALMIRRSRCSWELRLLKIFYVLRYPIFNQDLTLIKIDTAISFSKVTDLIGICSVHLTVWKKNKHREAPSCLVVFQSRATFFACRLHFQGASNIVLSSLSWRSIS